jgi:hypothetical protein
VGHELRLHCLDFLLSNNGLDDDSPPNLNDKEYGYGTGIGIILLYTIRTVAVVVTSNEVKLFRCQEIHHTTNSGPKGPESSGPQRYGIRHELRRSRVLGSSDL